jgi:hypothetical protein
MEQIPSTSKRTNQEQNPENSPRLLICRIRICPRLAEMENVGSCLGREPFVSEVERRRRIHMGRTTNVVLLVLLVGIATVLLIYGILIGASGAVGNTAVAYFAAGTNLAQGVFAAAQFALGILAAGMFAAGLAAAGLFALGIFSAGVFAAGVFPVGIFSLGIYPIGIFAAGPYARGLFVVGPYAQGLLVGVNTSVISSWWRS